MKFIQISIYITQFVLVLGELVFTSISFHFSGVYMATVFPQMSNQKPIGMYQAILINNALDFQLNNCELNNAPLFSNLHEMNNYRSVCGVAQEK